MRHLLSKDVICGDLCIIECDISVISSSSSGFSSGCACITKTFSGHRSRTSPADVRGQRDEKKGPSHFLKCNTLPGINLKICKQGLCMAQNMFRSCVRRQELPEQGKRMEVG